MMDDKKDYCDIATEKMYYLFEHGFRGTKEDIIDLIKEGANLNVANEESTLMLYLRYSGWNLDIVKLLVENGADVNHISDDDCAPLHYCMGRPDIAKFLIDSGADINATNSAGLNPIFDMLFSLNRNGRESMKKDLLEIMEYAMDKFIKDDE